MAEKKTFFGEFIPIDPERWQTKLEKELKGSLPKWELLDGIELDPFVHSNKTPVQINSAQEWGIAELFSWPSESSLNPLLLESLRGGVNNVLIDCHSDQIEVRDLRKIFKGVRLDYIRVHFNLKQYSPDILKSIASWTNQDNKSGGTVSWGGAHEPEMIIDCKKLLPSYRSLVIDVHNKHEGSINAVNQLVYLFDGWLAMVDHLTDKGWSLRQCIEQSKFILGVGRSYFIELAKFRAARLLWANILDCFQNSFPDEELENIKMPPLEAWVGSTEWTEDENTNRIWACTQAMSAILGGVDSLLIPGSKNNDPSAFDRRIARNIHHLLSFESQIRKVSDPAAGSYYIDSVTKEIVDKSWHELS